MYVGNRNENWYKAVFARIRILRFFSDFKKRDFCWFLKMSCQKVVKSRYQKFSPQSFEVITGIHQSLSLIFPKNRLLKLKIWLGYDANITTQRDV